MSNPLLFQGENSLRKKHDYFEGWYFKVTNGDFNISFIPGINIQNGIKKAFIQVITNDKSYFIDYDIDDFKFCHSPFYILVGNNYFSLDKIIIDIDKEIAIKGILNFSNSINIKTNNFSPNIMGPFSYFPMECSHAIISMKNSVNGMFKIDGDEINFKDGIVYIEKDWGYSFPQSYIWVQGSSFKNKKASFMCSVARVPFLLFSFRGVICVIIVDGVEYKFTTYNHTKIIKYDVTDSSFKIILKKRNYTLEICSFFDNGHLLIAPVKGGMSKNILESISSKVSVTLREKNKVIFSDTSINSGLEIVNE